MATAAYTAMAAAATAAATAAAIASGVGAATGDLSTQSNPPTSAYIGYDRIPYNGYRVIAHEGEAVLNRRDAETWRSLAASDGSGNRSSQSNGGANGDSPVIIHMTINGAREPKRVANEVSQKLQATLSRRNFSQRAYDGVQPGGQQR